MSRGIRVDRQPAWVLHRRALRETSFLLDLLTRDHGRVGVVARGARGGRGGADSSCQPFRPLLVSWSGRGELKTLARAEPAGAAPAVVGEQLFSALYLNEVLVRALAPFDAHPALFDAYGALLAEIGAADLEARLRRFELQLLGELGYALDFETDAERGTVLEPTAQYRLAPAHGFLLAPDSAPAQAYEGRALLAIGRGDFSELQTRRAARRLMREALSPLVGDRPLRSREYFRPPRPQDASG